MADFGLSEAGLALSAIGTGVGALGAISQANAQKQQATYQAEVAKNNQIIAEQNAQYASQAGAAQTEKAQLQQRAIEGEIGAGLAAGGVDINTGSPALTRTAAAETKQLDTATVSNDAALRVYGFRTQATNYGAQSELFQQEARQAPIAGLISGGSTLLSGGGGLASKWAAWQNPIATGDWSPRPLTQ